MSNTNSSLALKRRVFLEVIYKEVILFQQRVMFQARRLKSILRRRQRYEEDL